MTFTCNKCGAWRRRRAFLQLPRAASGCADAAPAGCGARRAGVRSTRLVNPEALARGTVFVQCAYAPCAVWHKVADGFDWWGDEYTDLQGAQGGAGRGRAAS